MDTLQYLYNTAEKVYELFHKIVFLETSLSIFVYLPMKLS